MKFRATFLLFFIALLYFSCSKDVAIFDPVTGYKTRNVIILVVDGPRYTETWGHPTHQYIPHRSTMLQQGVLCSNFYNDGVTATNPGHAAVCTGVYQNLENSGLEYPANPSFFQCWLKKYQRSSSEAWIIATKDKLEVLSNCTNIEWKDMHRPMSDCGNMGIFTGYREDSTTFKKVKYTLMNNHPRLMLINFKQPDAAAHANDSAGYLLGIIDTDNYVHQLWQQLQSDDFYKNKTTLIVTDDHGRHTAGHLDGFVSHGDTCMGCRHIEFFAIGPDFKQNYISNEIYGQIDIASTVAELMNFEMPYAQGKVMRDVFLR
ncbi:MAG: sulfatase-like hydrolase/transferase [Bacteroidota bacterium]